MIKTNGEEKDHGKIGFEEKFVVPKEHDRGRWQSAHEVDLSKQDNNKPHGFVWIVKGL